MKNLVIVLMVFIPLLGMSQSKSELKASKIKSRTIERTEQKDGVTTTYKEFYEEYDKNGYTILQQEFNKTGEVKSKDTYKYDNFGNVSEKVEYDKKSGNTVKTVYKYDANGEKIEETDYDSGGSVKSRQVYSVDSKGLKKETKEYNSKGELKWIKKYSYSTF